MAEDFSSLKVGDKVFLRTVTYHYTGEIATLDDETMILKKAAWVADSCRFSKSVEKGVFSELEIYPSDMPVFINRKAIVDTCRVQWDLPRENVTGGS